MSRSRAAALLGGVLALAPACAVDGDDATVDDALIDPDFVVRTIEGEVGGHLIASVRDFGVHRLAAQRTDGSIVRFLPDCLCEDSVFTRLLPSSIMLPVALPPRAGSIEHGVHPVPLEGPSPAG